MISKPVLSFMNNSKLASATKQPLVKIEGVGLILPRITNLAGNTWVELQRWKQTYNV